jgi:methylated-DNA-[protein]-cysteine S-methyltransferase
MIHRYNLVESPLGPLTAAVDAQGALAWLSFGDISRFPKALGQELVLDPTATTEVERQLTEYFHGCRKTFDLPLAPRGSAFQQEVWTLLAAIPYGETATYGALAAQLGRPAAARAVGRANATNPIAIIVPCHRVIGASGSLTGYAYGLSIKERLLALERSTAG